LSKRKRDAADAKLPRLVVGGAGAFVAAAGVWLLISEPSRQVDAAGCILIGLVLVGFAIFGRVEWLGGFGP
jgi:hypothetical protein